MELIAHRARTTLWRPADGLAVICATLSGRPDRVELDAVEHRGRLVVAHDRREARLSGIAALDDALELVAASPCGVLLDLKGPDRGRPFGEALAAADLGARTIVCGDLDLVGQAAGACGAARAWTLPGGRRSACQGIERAATEALGSGRCDAVSVDHRRVTARLVAAVHSAGGSVLAWTVNDAAQILHLRSLCIDGLITDDAVAARRVLGVAQPISPPDY